MLDISQALLPVFLVILFGYTLRRIGFPGDDFWPHIERVVYFVLFPTLLFNKLARAPLDQLDVVPMMIALVLIILLIAVITLLLKPLLRIDGAAFSSLFQGNIRFNGYIAIAIAAMLNPANGVTLAAIAIMPMSPLMNTLSVLVLAFYASQTRPDWRSIGNALMRNPLIIGCMSGVLVNWLALPLPQTAWRFAEILGAGALPLGLLAVGAALRFESMRDQRNTILLSIFIKLMLTPALAWLLCLWLNLDAQISLIVMLIAALPTTSSAYVLARQMGGAHELMANIITLQTLAAIVTVPFILIGFR